MTEQQNNNVPLDDNYIVLQTKQRIGNLLMQPDNPQALRALEGQIDFMEKLYWSGLCKDKEYIAYMRQIETKYQEQYKKADKKTIDAQENYWRYQKVMGKFALLIQYETKYIKKGVF